MTNILFSNFTQTITATLSGASGSYTLRCNFPPFVQKDFINRLEEEFSIQRITSHYDKHTATGSGTIHFQSPKTGEQIVDAIDYIFSTYIDSRL